MKYDEDAADRALTDALQHRLPRHRAPEALKRRLEEEVARSEAVTMGPQTAQSARGRPRSVRAWARSAAPALVAGLALAAGVALYYERAVLPRVEATARLDTEAVNDHLRILYSEHPLDVENGGLHQVKPWFAPRLDFAPAVSFAGDADFPLQGGAVSYFLDRKAATFVFKRRLHVISLLVFRSDGLSGLVPGASPAGPGSVAVPLGRLRARASRVRGFNVLTWQDGELGYALVSDLDAGELAVLGGRIVSG